MGFDRGWLALAGQAAPEDWQGVGHAGELAWLALAGRVVGGLFVALVLVYVVRALAVRKRYRAVSVLGAPERAALQREIEAIERGTRGELFVVCLERSDRHPAAEWIAGVATALVLSGLLAGWLPWDHPFWLLGAQLLFGLAGFAAARALPDFKRRFVSPARATEMADEQAFIEFFRHRLHRTEERLGVLIFVSLFEHRVVVLGDEGISAVVPDSLWTAVDDAVLAGARRGALRDGLAEGIRRAGAVLNEHFPLGAENRDELPDHVVVRRE